MPIPRTGSRPSRPPAPAAALALAAALATATIAGCGPRPAVRDLPLDGARAATLPAARHLPPLVLVLGPPARDPGQVPGLGPGGRTLRTGGRLYVRDPDGTTRPLLPAGTPGAPLEARDPAVDWDGSRIAFSGWSDADSAWRIYLVRRDGEGLTALTHSDRVLDLAPLGPGAAARFARYDDFDPCWLPDGRLVFASTRLPQVAQQGGGDVPNLFTLRPDGGRPVRITTERNGAEEPGIDPRSGRVVYARWFLNPYRASDIDPQGVTTDPARALPADRVDLWHAISVLPDGDGAQLAGGNPRVRLETQCSQPCVLDDGTLVGVVPAEPSLLPGPGATALVAYPGGIAAPRWLARGGHAASPAALPDGRVLFSFDPTGDGGFGLFVVRRDGSRPEVVLARPGLAALDAVPLVARPRPPRLRDQGGIDDPAALLPATRVDQVKRLDDTFRFDCLNVYRTGPVDSPFPDAPPIADGVRIRFFATVARPGAAFGDSVVLVRESVIEKSGAVHEHDIAADVPMFEQLVDGAGHVLRTAMGPAHVPGSNFARVGSGTKCVGCHAGHSALPAPPTNLAAKWFDAAPSAAVEVSGTAPGAAPPHALVDRRAAGPVMATGWVADHAQGAWARLRWSRPIEAREFVLYAPCLDRAAGTDLEVRGCELAWSRGGRELGRRTVRGPLSPHGTHVAIPPVVLDAVEIRLLDVRGRVAFRKAAALAEIEAIARLTED